MLKQEDANHRVSSEVRRALTTQTTLISVDSSFRTAGSTDTSWRQEINRITHVTAIDVVEALVPNTFFQPQDTDEWNVTTQRGQVERLPTNTSTAAVSASQLCARLSLSWAEGVSDGLSLSYDGTSSRFTLTNASATPDGLVRADLSPALIAALGMGGTTATTDEVLSSGSSLTFPLLARLRSEEPYLALQVEKVGVMEVSTFGQGRITAKIMTDTIGSFVGLVTHDRVFAGEYPLASLNELNVSLRRRDGSTYELDGLPWSCTLRVRHLV
jgi:hypothetical protein